MARKNVSSGSPYEKSIGFSRASRIGHFISVAGTAPISSDGSTAFPGDIYNQTKCCLEIIQNAIEQAGGNLDNVIRTRVMLTDISRWEEAAKAHGEFFTNIRHKLKVKTLLTTHYSLLTTHYSLLTTHYSLLT